MITLDIKKILKYLKLNESNISMILGALVIIILGVIVINYFRNQPQGQVDTGASTMSAEPTDQPIIQRGAGPVEYTVAKGETLWDIAEKEYGSGYNWTDISQANNLKNPDSLAVGQKLEVPDVEPKTLTVKGSENAQNSDQISGSTYIVRHGDNLWDIAVRSYGNGYNWVKIAEVNKLANPSIIHSGNTLAIPR